MLHHLYQILLGAIDAQSVHVLLCTAMVVKIKKPPVSNTNIPACSQQIGGVKYEF